MSYNDTPSEVDGILAIIIAICSGVNEFLTASGKASNGFVV